MQVGGTGLGSGPDAARRRQAVVLFADMADYTPLAEKLGEEDTFHLMQKLLGQLGEAVQKFGGEVQYLTGDGLMALFGAPVALEDAPGQAARAALHMQMRMADEADSVEASYGFRPMIRIGLHAGPIVIGEVGAGAAREVTALGDTINLASRLQAAADPGGILTSADYWELVDGRAEGEAAGAREIKGKSGAVETFALRGIGQAKSNATGEAEFVGRTAEIERLEALWDRAANGKTVFATVTGEAGLGKSRVAYAARDRIAAPNNTVLTARCRAEGISVPFQPFADAMRGAFGIDAAAGLEDASGRIIQGLAALSLNPGDHLPYLLAMLGQKDGQSAFSGMTLESVGIHLRTSLLAIMRAMGAQQPALILMEDVHWIDAASADLLDRLAADEDAGALMVLATTRPVDDHDWQGRTGHQHIRLKPLEDEALTELVCRQLDAGSISARLTDITVGRCGGNPLFLGEVVRYLKAHGKIAVTDNSADLHGDTGEGAVPLKLENIILGAVEHLNRDQRDVLDAAAVVGERFEVDVVSAMLGRDAGELCEAVAAAGLVRSMSRGGLYRFHHALTRDAIYASLLRPARADLHLRAAEAIEEKAKGDPEAVHALAYQYAETANAAKAIHYLYKAGDQSMQVYALEAGEDYFSRALDLIDRNEGVAEPEAAADLVLSMTRVHYFNADFNALNKLTEAWLPRFEQLGDDVRLSRLLFEAGYSNVFRFHFAAGKAQLDRALALGEQAGDDSAVAHAMLGLVQHALYCNGRDGAGFKSLDGLIARTVEKARKVRNSWVISKAQLAGLQRGDNFGHPEKSRGWADQMMETSREHNDMRIESMALSPQSLAASMQDDFQGGMELARAALEKSLCPIDRSVASGSYNLCAVRQGGDAAAEGARQIAVLAAQFKGKENLTFECFGMMVYGAVLAMQGRIAEGVHVIDEYLALAEERGAMHYCAIGYWMRGEVYLAIARGEERPDWQTIKANLGFLIRTVPVAGRRATADFNAMLEIAQAMEMPTYSAVALRNLGHLSKSRKKSSQASNFYNQALDLCRQFGLDKLAPHIEADLAAVG